MYHTQQRIKIEGGMEGLRNDLLFTAYSENTSVQSTGGPKAHKVSLSSTGEEIHFLPTPPDSPVFAELTTAGQDIKPDITKLKQLTLSQEGPQAVPNLEMNPSLADSLYLNTVYSPYQTTLPFNEGTYCDDPITGASNNVLVKQESDMFPDVFPSSLDSMCDQTNPIHYMHGWESETIMSSVFEAAPIIRDEYSIPSPTPSSPFDSTSGFQMDSLPDFNSFTAAGPLRSRDHLNSGSCGEDTEFDSGSEASFSLTTADSDDSLDDILPFDPNNTLCNPSIRPRTHHYKRNTVNVTMMEGGIPKVTIPSKKPRPRGRPRKTHSFNGIDGNGMYHNSGRRGRGKREAMKGNHLWEFIRDLLKNPSYNPKFIRWEEKEDGVFRFVNSEAVATMWGRKKNNPAMTYEKLSRAMRYYYKRDILERVDGRRLVYKFGEKATGWREPATIKGEFAEK